jgi:hypothetical protein
MLNRDIGIDAVLSEDALLQTRNNYQSLSILKEESSTNERLMQIVFITVISIRLFHSFYTKGI